MGFFSMNEHSNLASNFEFPVVEGYDGTIGCGIALVEGYQNDLALFTAAVQYDMSEMYSIKEGVSDEVLQEGAVETAKRMWEAIKQFFIKLGAKIKAIFTAFIAKLQSYFTKDLKGFVKKYEKNLNGKDFKDMKAKFSKPKFGDSYIGGKSASDSFNDVTFEVDYTKKAKEDYERSEVLESYYKLVSGSKATTKKEYNEWLHEECFEDEEMKDDWDPVSVRACGARLTTNTKALSDLEKSNKNAQTAIKKVIDNIEKEQKRVDGLWKNSKDGKTTDKSTSYMTGFVTGDDGKPKAGSSVAVGSANSDIVEMQKALTNIREDASCYQEVILAVCAGLIAETKFGIAQDKRIFTKAVGYKTVKEETLLTAIEECATDEVYEYFENPAIVA